MGSEDGAGGVYSRSFQSKMNILHALNELCKEKSFLKVSVNDIAEQAGISRSNFYYHFEDKNAAMQWLTTYFYERGIDQTGRTLTWLEGQLVTTGGFRAFSSVFISAAENTDYSGPQPFYVRHRRENLTRTLVEYQKIKLTNRLVFQIEALSHAEKVMALNYQNGQFAYSLKEFCENMVSLVPKELYKALEHPVSPDPSHEDFLDVLWS